jgi:tRNA(adenine34) deaminase
MGVNYERWMKEAFEEGLKAFDEGEVPIGAVVVKDGMIIGRGHNRTESLNDPTAHAEIIAISAASNTLKSWRLKDATLFVTVEPCLMCGGAILHSRIKKVVYGVKELKFGCFGTVTNILEKNTFNHTVKVEQTDILKEDIENLLIEFFRQKRQKAKAEKE